MLMPATAHGAVQTTYESFLVNLYWDNKYSDCDCDSAHPTYAPRVFAQSTLHALLCDVSIEKS